MMDNKTLSVTVISDFICPWCYVAERRLKKVAAELGLTLDLHFIPYELNPTMPPQGMHRKEYRTRKFGSWAYSQKLDAGTVEASKNDSITFHYEKIEVTPNTRKAHRLVWFVSHYMPEKKAELVDRIFYAYFTEGTDIGDSEILANLAVEVGLIERNVMTFLESESGTDEVIQLENEALALGKQGVPFIQIGSHHIYGAQSTEVMRQTLVDALEEQQAMSCSGGSCSA
jgi:predicted DsbA family dithiol-disulfide isomerase